MTGENAQGSPKGGVYLTKSLIAQRNLNIPWDKVTPESISQALASLQVLRLDRENITHITHLQDLEQLHSIYLQQNQIEKIENLSSFPQLKFLSLSGNRIGKVENLRSLTKLQFLDLSQNCIETLDTDELPRSLVFLDLTGNKCTKQNGYRERVLSALPRLKQLDAKDVPNQKHPVGKKQEEEEDDDSSEDSDYKDWPELSCPLSAEKEFFPDIHHEFTSRSARRRDEAIAEHEARLEELKQQQKLRELVFNTSQSGLSVQSGSEAATPDREAILLHSERSAASTRPLRAANLMNSAFQQGLRIPEEFPSSSQAKNSKGDVLSSIKVAKKVKK